MIEHFMCFVQCFIDIFLSLLGRVNILIQIEKIDDNDFFLIILLKKREFSEGIVKYYAKSMKQGIRPNIR